MMVDNIDSWWISNTTAEGIYVIEMWQVILVDSSGIAAGRHVIAEDV